MKKFIEEEELKMYLDLLIEAYEEKSENNELFNDIYKLVENIPKYVVVKGC